MKVSAQSQIRGRVVDEEDYPVSYATVALLNKTDSTQIGGGITDEEGVFAIACDSVEVTGRVSYIGMTTATVLLSGRRENLVVLRHDTQMLEEVVVEGDRSYHVKHTANGEIFYLSKYAKNSGDPFKALQEIPVLRVSRLEQSVKTMDGITPLVLVDGKSVNSGIAPINPKDIESVEVIDVADARYLHNNVRNILNIRLKKKRKAYKWVELNSGQYIPVHQGKENVSFETGNPKLSLYGDFSCVFLHHKDFSISSWQKDELYYKRNEGRLRNDGETGYGELMLKWTPNDNDYFAAETSLTLSSDRSKGWGNGFFQEDAIRPFSYMTNHKNKYSVLTFSAYYRHDIKQDRSLEIKMYYNRNENKLEGKTEESYTDADLLSSLADMRFRNHRSSGSLDVDYSHKWDTGSVGVGSSTRMTIDRIELTTVLQPPFDHKEWQEYAYASYSGQWNRMRFMASAGIKGTWLTAGDKNSSYARPHVSLSMNYSFNPLQSFRLSYTRTNTSPSVGQLNPFNTSTDPLVVIRGNPDLKPIILRDISCVYRLYANRLGFSAGTSCSFYTDMIESHGYVDNGILIRTYRNAGKYARLNLLSTGINYSLAKGLGAVYLSYSHSLDFFEDQTAKHSNSVSLGGSLNLKKWELSSLFQLKDYSYTAISSLSYKRPLISRVAAGWQATRELYLGVNVDYLFGNVTETTVRTDTWSSCTHQEQLKCWSPWVTVRYTLRRNPKQQIKLGNVLHGSEQGIKL